ncbi:MAG: hypothetical protein CYG59_04150 [Chloroflexi bacterium]|nr:MAG: hypothetical protein CYG59_04150 [Chloroflexota bacterium]
MNLQRRQQFQNNHRVLNHATRPNRAVSCISLQPTAQLCSTGAAGIGLDEHIERRRGARFTANRICRDAARACKSFFVKTGRLRYDAEVLPTRCLRPLPDPMAGSQAAL